MAGASRGGDPDRPGLPERSDEALVRAAGGGDAVAFGELYDRYERRLFAYAYRLLGSREDAGDAVQDAIVKVLRRIATLAERDELNVSAYLFTATRNAAYDISARRTRTPPIDVVPEPTTAEAARTPAPVDLDPERAALLEGSRDQIRAAHARLPARHREVLALRELDGRSYDEIGAIMGLKANAVAQLISRARLRLRAELRREALASVGAGGAGSADCERALPLIARRDDGELADLDRRGWLARHLRACAGCRASEQAMQEAGVSYRAWAPLVPLATLRDAAVAHAAESLGFDPAAVPPRRDAVDGRPAEPEPGEGRPRDSSPGLNAARRLGRRSRLVVAGLAALALALAVAALLAPGAGDEQLQRGVPASDVSPQAGVAPAARPARPARRAPAGRRRRRRTTAVRGPRGTTPPSTPPSVSARPTVLGAGVTAPPGIATAANAEPRGAPRAARPSRAEAPAAEATAVSQAAAREAAAAQSPATRPAARQAAGTRREAARGEAQELIRAGPRDRIRPDLHGDRRFAENPLKGLPGAADETADSFARDPLRIAPVPGNRAWDTPSAWPCMPVPGAVAPTTTAEDRPRARPTTSSDLPLVVALALLATSGIAAHGSRYDRGRAIVSPAPAVSTIRSAAPELVEPNEPAGTPGGEVEPALAPAGPALAVVDSDAEAAIDRDADAGFAVDEEPGSTLRFAPRVATSASGPQLVGSDAALFANTQPAADTLPWAKDARGFPVAASYAVRRGNEIVLTVRHRGLGRGAYPVVADPAVATLNAVARAARRRKPRNRR